MIDLLQKLDSNEFSYNLPDERIAKYPLEKRDMSKLLHFNKGTVADKQFIDLPNLLPAESLLVFNNTKVVHARLEMFKDSGARIENVKNHPP